MRTVLRLSAVAIAAVLTITPLVGAWSSFGASEPDTSYDTEAWMWPDAGPAPGGAGPAKARIYFNAWSATQASFHPNVGALETRFTAIESERPAAILGVWIDCNGDGYVGHIESALYEYPSELLLEDSACPFAEGDLDNWTVGAHNYNGWVTELIPIGPLDNNGDSKVYRAADVRMWVDSGRPGESSLTSGGGSCGLTPLPRGTLQSTGGLLNYVDCSSGLYEVWNIAAENATLPSDLQFEDDDDGRGSFADVGTFGSEDSKHAAVTTRDCVSEETFFDSAATANDTGAAGPVQTALDAGSEASGEDLGHGYEYYGFSVPALQPEVGNTQDPNAPGQLNQTNEEHFDDCNTSNDDGHDFYSAAGGLGLGDLPEGDQVSVPSVGKNNVDWTMTYTDRPRGDMEDWWVLGLEDVETNSDDEAGMPTDFGVGPSRGLVGAAWVGDSNLLRTPLPLVPVAVRAGLNTDSPADSNPRVVAADGVWITYFAFVSSDVTSQFTTTSGSGIYGFEQCGDNTEGIHNGWDCDASNWNLGGDGQPLPGQEQFAAPGQPYNFRDVDCYNDENNLGVSAQTALESEDPCTRL